jgi:hypothetical protein
VLVDDQRVRLTLGINDTKFVRDNIDEIKKYVMHGWFVSGVLLFNKKLYME